MDKKKSREDYLETIYSLSLERELVRAIDIARERDFSRPSVSIALKKLVIDGLINIQENGNIVLTRKGLPLAIHTYDKHQTIATLLMNMGVSKTTAYDDACKMEHGISDESLDKIKDFIGQCYILSKNKKEPFSCQNALFD
ncbi:MAG: metal-dependent transcriptional regulator [Erysipelotrichaceae bacterium]